MKDKANKSRVEYPLCMSRLTLSTVAGAMPMSPFHTTNACPGKVRFSTNLSTDGALCASWPSPARQGAVHGRTAGFPRTRWSVCVGRDSSFNFDIHDSGYDNKLFSCAQHQPWRAVLTSKGPTELRPPPSRGASSSPAFLTRTIACMEFWQHGERVNHCFGADPTRARAR